MAVGLGLREDRERDVPAAAWTIVDDHLMAERFAGSIGESYMRSKISRSFSTRVD